MDAHQAMLAVGKAQLTLRTAMGQFDGSEISRLKVTKACRTVARSINLALSMNPQKTDSEWLQEALLRSIQEADYWSKRPLELFRQWRRVCPVTMPISDGFLAGTLMHSANSSPYTEGDPELAPWLEDFKSGRDRLEISTALEVASARLEQTNPKYREQHEKMSEVMRELDKQSRGS